MMGFLLDTNVPSELIRTRPDSRVGSWVYAQDEQLLHLSFVSLCELRRGFAMLPASPRRADLEQWLERDLLLRFRGRILPLTYAIVDRWGAWDRYFQLKGKPLNTADGMIAATALEHDFTLVTRNVRDFAELGVAVFNPWDAV